MAGKEIFGLILLSIFITVAVGFYFSVVIKDFNEDTLFWRFCCIIPGINIIMFILFFIVYLPFRWALNGD